MARFITIQASQLNSILNDLGQFKSRASNLKPVALSVALVIAAYTDNVFDNAPSTTTGGTAANGFDWKPLSAKYLKAKGNRGGGKSKRKSDRGAFVQGKLLQDTGALLNSLQPNGLGNFFKSGNDFIEYGSILPQAANNNTRTFLAHTEELTEQVANVFQEYILNGIK